MPLPVQRHRSSSDVETSGQFLYRWAGDSYSTVRAIDNWQSLRRYEYIIDVVGTTRPQRVKPVSHVSIVYSGLSYQPFAGDYGLMIVPLEGSLPYIVAEDLVTGEFALSQSLRTQAAGEAFTFFAERFPTKISGAEFVQGLTQLKQLLPKLERTVVQTISSAYLKKTFGWDNLLSDLESFISLAGSIRQRMEFLKRTHGKPTKLYFRKPGIQTSEFTTSVATPVRGFGTRLTLQSYTCDFSAQATLLQELSHIDDFAGWLRAIVISLGLNNPLRAAWQTSRLSFVVDWLFNVSGHLARLAAVQPAELWDVSNVSSSIRSVAKYTVHQVNTGITGISDQELYLGTLVVKQYERKIGLPVDLSIYTPSTLTPDQLVLLTAMAGAK